MKDLNKYYVKRGSDPWTKVTKEQYIHAEREAGFRSKFGPESVATASFTSFSQGKSLEGTVIYPGLDLGLFSFNEELYKVITADND